MPINFNQRVTIIPQVGMFQGSHQGVAASDWLASHTVLCKALWTVIQMYIALKFSLCLSSICCILILRKRPPVLSKQADQSQPTIPHPAEAGIDEAKVTNDSVILNKHTLLLVHLYKLFKIHHQCCIANHLHVLLYGYQAIANQPFN